MPTNQDLAHAFVVIGADVFAIPEIADDTINRLRELGLICWNNGQLELTPAGQKLLPTVLDGGNVELA